MYSKGYGVEIDYVAAIKWYKQAAEQNDTFATYNLGSIYFNGRGVDKDYNKAFKYYEVAADLGDSGARFQLGNCYFYGNGTDKDEDRGLILMSEVSDKNDYQICVLGAAYHSTNSRIQNFLKALELYQKVFEGIQHSYALRGIGLLYEYGDGVDQSYHEALIYYKQASDQNNKGAYYNIALLYYYGKGVVKDYATSLDYFNKIIKEKVNNGSAYVCVQIKNEDKTEISPNKQKMYSLEPESFIYGEAYYYLSVMYEKGQGISMDHDKSEEHRKIAMSHGKKCRKTL